MDTEPFNLGDRVRSYDVFGPRDGTVTIVHADFIWITFDDTPGLRSIFRSNIELERIG